MTAKPEDVRERQQAAQIVNEAYPTWWNRYARRTTAERLTSKDSRRDAFEAGVSAALSTTQAERDAALYDAAMSRAEVIVLANERDAAIARAEAAEAERDAIRHDNADLLAHADADAFVISNAERDLAAVREGVQAVLDARTMIGDCSTFGPMGMDGLRNLLDRAVALLPTPSHASHGKDA